MNGYGYGGNQFAGASDHRLFADWFARLQEPSHVWTREWQELAARAVSLVCNDPFASAMVGAKLRETHGPTGMRLRSAYSEMGGTITTKAERARRREIEAVIDAASAKRNLDASGQLTRRQMDKQVDWIATVMGECWKVWVWKPGRPGAPLAGCWRIVTPDRVENPDRRPNDDRLRDGLYLDADGAVEAISVRMGNVGPFGTLTDLTWKKFPIFDPATGMRLVCHHRGFALPGMMRGISMFAPALLLMRQTQGTVESHVAGKRAQAVNPIVYFTEDEKELADSLKARARLGQNATLGPMSVLVAKYGSSDVKFMENRFNGSDLRDFLTTMYRSLTAMWGFPWQVVLAEMGEASLASARAGLDQADRTAADYATDFQDNVSKIVDENILREAATRKLITFGTDDWCQITAGRYSRPPKYSTDRLKDANTIKALREAGVSGTTSFELFGLSFEDEVEQEARDREFEADQGIRSPAAEEPATDAAPAEPEVEDSEDDQAEDDAETTPEPAEAAP